MQGVWCRPLGLCWFFVLSFSGGRKVKSRRKTIALARGSVRANQSAEVSARGWPCLRGGLVEGAKTLHAAG
jgi:hypothetical protein